jgi:hypothetical protein
MGGDRLNVPSPAMRDLARQLLASSRSSPSGMTHKGGPPVHEAVKVCETLRIAVTRFAGSDGFEALLRRALALARAESPALKRIRLGSDGQIEGFEEIAAQSGGAEAAVALAAQLLTLLVTFIGEPLTLRLVREAWPDAQFGV